MIRASVRSYIVPLITIDTVSSVVSRMWDVYEQRKVLNAIHEHDKIERFAAAEPTQEEMQQMVSRPTAP